ncbi:MAG: multiheme c-type cytochrome [Planctomycetota bacterium]|jgi:hypothetical protein
MTMYKIKTWMVAIGTTAALTMGVFLLGSPAGAQEASKSKAKTKAKSKFQYVGSDACKKCHIKQYRSWEKTKMANTFEVLRPNSQLKENTKKGITAKRIAEIKEHKKKGKPPIDPEKDYTKDKTCLPCHTVGFGKTGGYIIADPKDKNYKKVVKEAKNREGVGCESCHGPGSEYVKIFKEIQKSKRKYNPEELHKAGMIKIDEKNCIECHNEKSTLMEKGHKFDYKKQKDKGTHKHSKLKQRIATGTKPSS